MSTLDIPERERWIAISIAVLAVIAYWPSLSVAFFLDDFRILLENPMLHDALDPAAIWRFSEPRFVASWTLAANYTLHGEAVFGYHVVNLVIHLIAGGALLAFVRALLASPALASRGVGGWRHWVPWIALAIFLLHPLQTQAVTYIVQRYTSLMAMFYLLTLALYAWGRIRSSTPLLIGAVATLVLAALSKQTAATLPLALLLVELLFFRRLSERQWGAVVAACAIGAVGLFALLHWPPMDVLGVTRETDRVSRLDYLATQGEVLWRYIGLFFLIGEQRLEYALPFADGFSRPATIMLALGHLALIAGAASLWRRLPLVAFGVLFYYLAHAIESSIFPIVDEAFEHRTYLPNAGFAVAAAFGLAWLAGHWTRFRAGAIVVAVVVLALSGATWARNALWSDRIAFLEHETALSPQSQRAWTSLGKELMRESRFQAALEALRQAERIAIESDGELRPPTILNMIFALHYTGQNQEAVRRADAMPTGAFSETELGFLHEARGRARLALDELAAARADLERSARLNPSPNAIAYLAEAERRLGNAARARQLAASVLEASPGHPLAREILRQTSR
jgi:tetratricopeptide (TPR) repeat protein